MIKLAPQSRRTFMTVSGRWLSASWLAASLPAIELLSACARDAAERDLPFKLLTAKEGAELDALAALIIPSDETPGAREAGAVHFIDLMLAEEPEEVEKFRGGLLAFQQRVRADHPGAGRFSELGPAQQIEFLRGLDARAEQAEAAEQAKRELRAAQEAAAEGGGAEGAAAIEELATEEPARELEFWENIRTMTVMGTFCHPNQGGNQDLAGWNILGLDPAAAFQPPFGFYDREYAEGAA